MGLIKNKIRLSKSLYAQTTPYPHAGRLLKNSIFVAILLLGAGIFVLAKPAKPIPAENAAAPKQILGEQEAAVEYLDYEVKKGDTLFNLSKKYEVSWQTLAELNRLKEPYILKIGQKLNIPIAR